MNSTDLLIYNGAIRTLDPTQSRATALVIRDNRLLAVGTDAAMQSYLRPGYTAIDAQGRTVVPGLCDAHVHLLQTARSAHFINLEGSAALDVALQRVADHVATAPDDGWLRGHGWDHSLWNGSWPTAAALDAVTGDRPTILTRKDLHSMWCNSAALRLAGIDATTPDPVGGALQRDEAGAPTGMLLEQAQQLVWRVVPEPDSTANEGMIAAFAPHYHRFGVSSVHVPERNDCFTAVQTLYERGDLSLRVLHHLWLAGLDHALALGLRSGLGDAWLRIGGVKIFSDGSLGSQTAWMLEPFAGTQPDALNTCGIPLLPPDELRATIARAIQAGISATVHAIGDAANRAVLDSIEAALRQQPTPPEPFRVAPAGSTWPHAAIIPHRIEHAQLLHPNDLPRLARLGIIASGQPIHATADIDVAERLWGDRAAFAYAWRSLLDAGTILAFGSDAPVETWNPWAGIHAAVTRQRPDGYPQDGWHPEQALTLDEALWAYTVGPAIASGELALKGTLSPGKLADLVVLDRNLDDTAASELHTVEAALTVIDGQVVWEQL